MADLTREALQQLARLGAKARLEDLRREESAIRQAFPGLFRGGRGGRRGRQASTTGEAPVRRRRGRMSAAARKAVSVRMKKYWAEQRKAKGAKSAK